MDSHHPETLSEQSYGNFSLLNMSRTLLGNDIVFVSVRNLIFFPFTVSNEKKVYRLNPFGKAFLDILYTNKITLIGYEEELTPKERFLFYRLFQKHGLFYLTEIVTPEDFGLTNLDYSFYEQLHLTYGKEKKIGFLSRKTVLYAKLHGLDSVKYVHPMTNPRRAQKKADQTHALFFSYGTFYANTTLYNGITTQSLPYEQGFGRYSLFCYDFCCWLYEKAVAAGVQTLFFTGEGYVIYECFSTLFPAFDSTLLFVEAETNIRERDLIFPEKASGLLSGLVLWKPVSQKKQENFLSFSSGPVFTLLPLEKKVQREHPKRCFSYVAADSKSRLKKDVYQAALLLARKEFVVTSMDMERPILSKTPEDDFQLAYLASLRIGILDFLTEFPAELEKILEKNEWESHPSADSSVLSLLDFTLHPNKKTVKDRLRARSRKIPILRKCYKQTKSFILKIYQKGSYTS
ncbi:MAG: hypothetical protein Q4B70_02590 [Lachnospiraceae bacterium]|nr:hypothetical protein [Lachnospiraceae bacterium]